MEKFYKRHVIEGSILPLLFVLPVAIVAIGQGLTAGAEPVDNVFWNTLFDHTHAVWAWVALAMNIISGGAMAYVAWHLSIVRKRSILPLSVNMALLLFSTVLLRFSPDLLAGFLCLLGFLQVLHLYQHPSPQTHLFRVGALLGLASLITPSAVLQLLPMLILLGFYRIFNMRNLLALILGVISVVWLSFVSLALLGCAHLLADHFLAWPSVRMLGILSRPWQDNILAIVVLTLLMLGFSLLQFTIRREKVQVRDYLNALYLLSGLFTVSYLFACWADAQTLLIGVSLSLVPIAHFFVAHHSKFKAFVFFVVVAICFTVSLMML